MIQITFPNPETERRALGYLAGRFSFQSRDDGVTLVPQQALARLAGEGITFTVEGRAAYEQSLSTVRDSSAPAV